MRTRQKHATRDADDDDKPTSSEQVAGCDADKHVIVDDSGEPRKPVCY